jgi:hypothetical protein
MRKQITFEHLGRRAGIAWLSFQPNGSISCGLKDRTFVSPRFRDRIGIWSAYNRYTISYEVGSNPDALVPVNNPHFTFHPAMTFHLKGQLDISSKGEDLFSAIADVAIVLEQQSEMPWLRLISQPISNLPLASKGRDDGIENSELVFIAPAIMENASASIDVDFIRASDVSTISNSNSWQCVWHGLGLRVKFGVKSPQIATLAWFHSY